MIATETRLEATVTDLFERLDETGIRYAVMRNHESFPRFDHDIDLVVESDALEQWRTLAASVAERHCWDALTECRHWARSPYRHHNIESFLFYAVEDDVCLQIDTFHGFLVWGLPFLDEAELLDRRERDARGFTRLDPALENLLRMLQINRLVANGADLTKVNRYRERVAKFATDGDPLGDPVALKLSPFLRGAVGSLLKNSTRSYRLKMECARLAFTARYSAAHPGFTVRSSVARIVDRVRLAYNSPCGFVLAARADTDRDRAIVSRALDALVASNTIMAWTASGATRHSVSVHERRVMEEGGLALKWSNARDVALDMRTCASDEEARRVITSLLVDRHELRWQRTRS